MTPALLVGDLVFVFKSEYNFRIPFTSVQLVQFSLPKPSDVVAFTLPDKGFQTFVKRVVAVEGDKIEIKNGILIVNDEAATYQPQHEPSGIDQDPSLVWEKLGTAPPRLIHWKSDAMKDYGPVDVPDGQFFAMGDNRADSIDSRVWGPVPDSCLKGKVELVWLSVNSEGGVRKDRMGIRIK